MSNVPLNDQRGFFNFSAARFIKSHYTLLLTAPQFIMCAYPSIKGWLASAESARTRILYIIYMNDKLKE